MIVHIDRVEWYINNILVNTLNKKTSKDPDFKMPNYNGKGGYYFRASLEAYKNQIFKHSIAEAGNLKIKNINIGEIMV